MEFRFETIEYDKTIPVLPKHSGIYKIFDLHGKLIVLDKTSNLFDRFERYYGERSERVRDLDLREITARIEYVRTDSTFETLYLLYRERKSHFPKTYRKMRTFRLFTLMKINPKQRFPRLYASRQIKNGPDYFGPFISRGQFARLKTTLERTFKLRPCLYNIRGNDPHPDCLYFQMHTCSRPCNNDIDRRGYLEDVHSAIAFIEGRDEELERESIQKMNDLAAEKDSKKPRSFTGSSIKSGGLGRSTRTHSFRFGSSATLPCLHPIPSPAARSHLFGRAASSGSRSMKWMRWPKLSLRIWRDSSAA